MRSGDDVCTAAALRSPPAAPPCSGGIMLLAAVLLAAAAGPGTPEFDAAQAEADGADNTCRDAIVHLLRSENPYARQAGLKRLQAQAALVTPVVLAVVVPLLLDTVPLLPRDCTGAQERRSCERWQRGWERTTPTAAGRRAPWRRSGRRPPRRCRPSCNGCSAARCPAIRGRSPAPSERSGPSLVVRRSLSPMPPPPTRRTSTRSPRRSTTCTRGRRRRPRSARCPRRRAAGGGFRHAVAPRAPARQAAGGEPAGAAHPA